MTSATATAELVPAPSSLKNRDALMAQARDALAKIFDVPGLTYSQRLAHAKGINASLAKLEYQTGLAQLTCRPAMIDLPVAGKCNLRCTMCSLSHGDPGYPNWTFDEVARFEPLFRYAVSVNPTGAGEPLTNRDFFAMLELFTGYEMHTGFYTNATLLTPDKTEKLIRLGINQVNISIDGATAETFEKIRHHAKFATVVGNARKLIERRRQLGLQLPRLQIAMVLMRDNIHELPDLVRLAADIGAESVYTMFVSPVEPEQICEREPVRANAMLREARRVADELKIRIVCPNYLPEHATVESAAAKEAVVPVIPANVSCLCSHPWQQFVVWNDGDVSPCCRIRDEVDGEKFGNIRDAAPEKLWNSPGLVRLRERLASKNPPHACQVCPIRTSAMH